MAEQAQHTHNYHQFLGVDYVTNKLKQRREFAAPGSKNFEISDDGIENRRGIHFQDNNDGRWRIFANYAGRGTGSTEVKKTLISSHDTGTLDEVRYDDYYTISYSGAGIGRARVFLDASDYYLELISDWGGGGETIELPATAITATTFTALNALIGGTASFSGAFTITDHTGDNLEPSTRFLTPGGDSRYHVLRTVSISGALGGGFSTDRFWSTALVHGALFISEGTGSVKCYDGNRLFSAGLTPSEITATANPVSVGTGLTDGNYDIRTTQNYFDNQGNLVQSEYGNTESVVAAQGAGLNAIEATIDFSTGGPAATATSSIDHGFAAVSPGIKVLTVSSPHGLQAGDTVFWNRDDGGNSSADFDFRVIGRVTATTSTTVTVDAKRADGTDLDIKLPNNGDTISTRWASYWITEGATAPADPIQVYYLGGEFALPSGSSMTRQVELTTTRLLKREILPEIPIGSRRPPPEGRYLTEFRGHLIVASVEDEPGNVFFSEPGQPHTFDLATGSFNVNNKNGDVVTGVHGSESVLFVGKGRSVYRITGDLGNRSFVVDNMSFDIGWESHFSVKQVAEDRLFFLSHKGPHEIRNNTQILPVGALPTTGGTLKSRIQPDFETRLMETTGLYPKLDLATAAVSKRGEKYYLHVPLFDRGDPAALDTYDLVDSRWYVFDFERDAWLPWDGIVADGIIGVIEGVDNPETEDEHLEKLLVPVDQELAYLKDAGVAADRSDDLADVGFDYYASWETLGKPSVFKKFNLVDVFSVDTEAFDLTILTNHDFRSYGVTNAQAVFSADEDNLKCKIARQKSRALQVQFQATKPGERVVINGWDIQWVDAYSKVKE